MVTPSFTLFTLLVLTTLFGYVLSGATKPSLFESALERLQNQIGYRFKNIELLCRAMTHSSFSEENNNKALSILGSNVIATAVSMRYIVENIDISRTELSRYLAEFSPVETSCSIDGKRLGLHNVVRVSPKTDSNASYVVCGDFMAAFGAIAIDAGNSDDARKSFWNVHGSFKHGHCEFFRYEEWLDEDAMTMLCELSKMHTHLVERKTEVGTHDEEQKEGYRNEEEALLVEIDVLKRKIADLKSKMKVAQRFVLGCAIGLFMIIWYL